MSTALYARVSTQEQAKDGYSIGEQQERLKSFAQAMSWNVYDVYVDAGFSGSNVNRPALQRLIDDVGSGIIDRVCVYKLDRLSRSQKDTLYLIEDVFLKNGCDFVSMSENLDTSSPFGKAMIGILAVFAQLEREQIRERMMMGQSAFAEAGGVIGTASIGYKYEKSTKSLVIDPYEAMQVKMIFERYLAGETVTEIMHYLNDAGYTHKNGKWIFATVRNVLKSRVYLGETKYDGKWHKSHHEPLITEEMHERAVRRLDETYQNHHRDRATKSLLGGLLFCGNCGARYTKDTTAHGDKKYSYYICCSRAKKSPNLVKDPDCKNKTWRMETLDALILDEIRKINLEEIEKPQETEPKEKTIRERLNAIDKQTERLVELYSLGSVPKNLLDKRLSELNIEKTKLNREITAERKNADLRQGKIQMINTLDELLNHFTEAEKRLVVTSLIEKITIDGEDITIHWNI